MEASPGLADSPTKAPVIGGGDDDHSVNLVTISPPDPLQPISHNQHRQGPSLLSPKDGRDKSVAEKVSQFNSMALQAKHQERKATDAALQRAVLGREEAEAEVRRLREEVKVLRQQVEEGKEREKTVSHRLEVVMEDYGRAKESLAHTQAIWEKEIRKARKETFKAQSDMVELQKQLKSTRTALKTAQAQLYTSRAAQTAAEEELEQQKGQTQARQQEAIEARNVTAALQEQLNKAMEHINTLEMERDAFKALAKSEELARIAAEAKIALPESKDVEMGGMELPLEPEDDFAALKSYIHHTADLKHSATSESEIEEVKELWQWERQRADRALELIAFMEVECNLKMCAGARAATKRPSIGGMDGVKRKRSEISPSKVTDAGDLVILSDASPSPCADRVSPPSAKRTKTEQLRSQSANKSEQKTNIFLPEQGIFRTVSQEELDPINRVTERENLYKRQRYRRTSDQSSRMADSRMGESQAWSEMQDSIMSRHGRTPDSEGVPDYVLDSERASLQSLLTAPHKRYAESISSHVMGNIPTIPASSVISSAMSGSVQTITASTATATTSVYWEEPKLYPSSQQQKENVPPPPQLKENEGTEGDRTNSGASHHSQKSQQSIRQVPASPQPPNTHTPAPATRRIDRLSESKLGYSPSSLAHASMFGSTTNSSTITTKVPLKEASTNADLGRMFRTPSKGSVASATSENAMDIDGDINVTKPRSESRRGELPVSREEALAMIRERRERGRSREIKSRPQSPEKRPLSPVKRPESPDKNNRRDASPNKRRGRDRDPAPSPHKRPESPSKSQQRAPSPNKQRNAASPTRRPLSPSKRTQSPTKSQANARVVSHDLSYASALKKSTADVMQTPGGGQQGTRSFSAPTAAATTGKENNQIQRGFKS
ncbi:hypothetical protein QBC32DRAFT_153771 [Pseudoneurospora amorphoporcata]|uniref:Uncharacterized protein n=1 Tax=Pseudoneurospora amorphoporcata TaxID=241081 RepID=A0AAN6SG37_9PEZI|nr:hypothetical protein QBC32DRAFT_153771 [Pseudoneurospora amorphoporcata]